MTKKPTDPFSAMAGPGAEAFRLWISFFPVAPLFGVEWRFADAMGGMSPFGVPGRPRSEPPRRSERSSDSAGAKSSAAPAEKTAPKVERASEQPRTASAGETVTVKPAQPAAPPKPAPQPKPAAEAKPEPAPKPEPAAEAKPDPAPRPAAEETAARDGGTKPTGLMSTAPSNPDDLKLIKGIGPGLESKLNALGIYKFEQIAKFSESDLVWVDENLTAFKGRCFRDDWVGQARGLIG